MSDTDPQRDARAARRRARATWPGRLVRQLDEQEVEIVDAPPGERVAMVYELTLAAWAMAGKSIPDYERAEMPIRIVSRGRR